MQLVFFLFFFVFLFFVVVFLQNKSCLKLSLFCMRTDDWLNFHVKFQSVHVNITNTAHHFFFYFFFLLFFFVTSAKLVKLNKTLVKLKTNAYIHVMCTNTLKKYIFYMLLTVSNLSVYWMSCETCVTSHETCVTIQRTSKVEEVFQYYFGICPQHQKLTRINTCVFVWSMVFVWSWRKNFSFHVTHVSVSQFRG